MKNNEFNIFLPNPKQKIAKYIFHIKVKFQNEVEDTCPLRTPTHDTAH